LCFEYCVSDEFFQRHKHKKELKVVTLLKNEIEQAFHSLDRPLESACNRKRPDIVYDCNTHLVIVEIDERQHRYYSCERRRLLEVVQSAGMPTFWIRYNPDEFMSMNDLGEQLRVFESERHKVLVRWIRHAIASSPDGISDFIRVVYLFYDGYRSGSHTEVERIDATDVI